MIGVHCRLKREEFKARAEGDGVVREIVCRLA